MRFRSIRTRGIVLAAVFVVIIVGFVMTATYYFVADGMMQSAADVTDRLGTASGRLVAQVTARAVEHAEQMGLTNEEAEELVNATVVDTVSVMLGEGLAADSVYTLLVIDAPGLAPRVAWTSADGPAPAPDPGCLMALELGDVVRQYPSGPPSLRGMFQPTDLGVYVLHLPVDIPGTHTAAIDIRYSPEREEAMLDASRRPMALVAVVALVGAVVVVNLIMGWILSLITTLKRVADSIEAGKLDVHLPEQGENEVTDLARSLNRLIDDLRHQNEIQARFIADASHELATPVAGIRGYVNILRAWGADDPALRDEAMRAIDRESSRMARLCSDLLSALRSEEAVGLRWATFDINVVCREVLASAATRYLGKDLDFAGPEDDVSITVVGDPDRIEEALGILVDNACKYTPTGGTVRVSTRPAEDGACIVVADTGIGIPAEDLPNVFERFYRSDASRSKETGGFGLGLAIAKRIIEANGGTIGVTSERGVGTTFEVCLPGHRPREL